MAAIMLVRDWPMNIYNLQNEQLHAKTNFKNISYISERFPWNQDYENINIW